MTHVTAVAPPPRGTRVWVDGVEGAGIPGTDPGLLLGLTVFDTLRTYQGVPFPQHRDVLGIEFDDKTRWRLGYRATNRLQSVTEYVLKDESVKEWSELYTVQRLYRLATKKTPSQLMQEMTKNLKKNGL